MKIDNFALTMHQSCPAKYDLRMRQGWTLRRRSAALGFGGAIHAGLAVWYKNMHLDYKDRLGLACTAIDEAWDDSVPVDDYRTKSKCIDVMMDYALTYEQESFSIVGAPEKPIIEQTFTLKLGTYLRCQTIGCESKGFTPDPYAPICGSCSMPREAIEYGGIFDGLAQFGDKVFVLEHKSTSRLGDYYFTQYKPNNQVAGYIWASTQMSGLEVGGALINAIGVYKSSKTQFKRQLTTRDSLDIDQFVRNVTATCEEIKAHEREGFFPQRTIACTQYGKCEFHDVHILSDPAWQQKRLETDYVRAEWDFTRRDDNAPEGEG